MDNNHTSKHREQVYNNVVRHQAVYLLYYYRQYRLHQRFVKEHHSTVFNSSDIEKCLGIINSIRRPKGHKKFIKNNQIMDSIIATVNSGLRYGNITYKTEIRLSDLPILYFGDSFRISSLMPPKPDIGLTGPKFPTTEFIDSYTRSIPINRIRDWKKDQEIFFAYDNISDVLYVSLIRPFRKKLGK